jgi:hypothetical protein
MFAVLSQVAERPPLLGMVAVSVVSMWIGLILVRLNNPDQNQNKPNAAERRAIGYAVVGATVAAFAIGLMRWLGWTNSQ